jgi:hypothetical protein
VTRLRALGRRFTCTQLSTELRVRACFIAVLAGAVLGMALGDRLYLIVTGGVLR